MLAGISSINKLGIHPIYFKESFPVTFAYRIIIVFLGNQVGNSPL
jgi:hypothetical protein